MSAMERSPAAEIVDFGAYRERRLKRAAAVNPTVEAMSPYAQPIAFQLVWFGFWLWPVAVVAPFNARA